MVSRKKQMTKRKKQMTKRKKQMTKRNPKRISRKKQRLTRKNTKMYKKRKKQRKQYTGGKRFRRYSTHDTYSENYFKSDLNKLIELLEQDSKLPRIIISHSNCMKKYMENFYDDLDEYLLGGASIEKQDPQENIPNEYLFIRHFESKNNSVKNDTTNMKLYDQDGGFISPRKMYRKFQNKDPHLSDHGIYSGIYYFNILFKNPNFKNFFEDKVSVGKKFWSNISLEIGLPQYNLGVSCLLRTWETAVIIILCYLNSLKANKPKKIVLLLFVLPFNKEVEKIGERASKFFVKRGLGNTPHDNFEKQKAEFLEFIEKLQKLKLYTGEINIKLEIDKEIKDLYKYNSSSPVTDLYDMKDFLKFSLSYGLVSNNENIKKGNGYFWYPLNKSSVLNHQIDGAKITFNHSTEVLKVKSAIDISSYTNGNLLFTDSNKYVLFLGPLQYKYMVKYYNEGFFYEYNSLFKDIYKNFDIVSFDQLDREQIEKLTPIVFKSKRMLTQEEIPRLSKIKSSQK